MDAPHARKFAARAARWPALAGLAISLAACYLLPREEKIPVPPIMAAAPVSYDEVQARRGTIEDKVEVTGSFVFVRQTSLFFRPPGGRLKGLDVAIGEELSAGTLVAELETGTLESRIEQQRLLLRRAQIEFERTSVLGKDRFDLELAEIEVALAQIQLRDLQAELERSRLLAPYAGVVVYLLSAREGEVVDAFRSIAEIADPSRLELVYQGDRASEFALGTKVGVRVADVDREGEVIMAPGSVPADATIEQRSTVVLRVRDLPPEVTRGDRATIILVRARKEDVVILPRSVVRSYLGRSYVQIILDGVKRERTVELGISGGTEVEILAGVSAGEKVLAR